MAALQADNAFLMMLPTHLPRLTLLHLNCLDITDAGLRHALQGQLHPSTLASLPPKSSHCPSTFPCLLHACERHFTCHQDAHGLNSAAGCPALRELRLAGCEGVTAAGMHCIGLLPHLQLLDLETCPKVGGHGV